VKTKRDSKELAGTNILMLSVCVWYSWTIPSYNFISIEKDMNIDKYKITGLKNRWNDTVEDVLFEESTIYASLRLTKP